MSNYQCLQCKECSVKPFEGGKCSRCGSLNIKKTGKPFHKQPKKAQESIKSLLVLIGLWCFIAYELLAYFF